MKDLLKNGPYEIKELTREQKQTLVRELLGDWEGVRKWDLNKPWYVSNNPMLDQVFDNRDKDFWQKGEEYPYPYVILYGGDTVEYQIESLSKEDANEMGIFLSR